MLCPRWASQERTGAGSGEADAGVALGDALCMEEDTADCVNLQVLLPTWMLMLSFSSSQAVAGVRHHLVALEAAATATRCTNVRQPDRVRYDSRAPRFAIGAYSLPLSPILSTGWGVGVRSVPTPPTFLPFPLWSTSPVAIRVGLPVIGRGGATALDSWTTERDCIGMCFCGPAMQPQGTSLVLDKPLGERPQQVHRRVTRRASYSGKVVV